MIFPCVFVVCVWATSVHSFISYFWVQVFWCSLIVDFSLSGALRSICSFMIANKQSYYFRVEAFVWTLARTWFARQKIKCFFKFSIYSPIFPLFFFRAHCYCFLQPLICRFANIGSPFRQKHTWVDTRPLFFLVLPTIFLLMIILSVNSRLTNELYESVAKYAN